MRGENIINELEAEFGVEIDDDFDLDILCDYDTCRHAECDCWDDLRNQVTSHLEEKAEIKRKRGSLEVYELWSMLQSASNGKPIFIDGKAIDEAYEGDDAFYITTKEAL